MKRLVAALLVLSLWPLVPVQSQGRNRQVTEFADNVPYDGRFTFVRVRYTMTFEGGFRRDIKWTHDYPRGERHFTKIVNELSTIRTRTESSNILTLDDPEITKYPVAYLCEAGFWAPSDAEVLGLRNYLLKGGFIIFDDFARNDWMNFTAQMKKVLPKANLVKLDLNHPIFDSFYKIETLDLWHVYYGVKSEFWGIYEDNDPRKRLLAVVNYNHDMSEGWEFSDEGLFPIETSNVAYKMGVNYLIYALTR